MTDGEKKMFDQEVESSIRIYDNIRKIATRQEDDYTPACWLNYNYLKEYYNMKSIDLSKQLALDADPRAIQHVNFT